MARVSVEIKTQPVWIVEAKCLDETQSWRFDEREDAERFSEVAQKYWNARCPKCGCKNMVNLNLSDQDPGFTAIASCGYHACSYAERIVSWDDPDEAN